MSDQISLKEAERKAFKTKIDDGLWDILLGSYFMMFVAAIYLSPSLGDFWSSAMIIPGIGFMFMVIWLLRKYVITPRIGSVKFGQFRKAKLMKFTKVMLAINSVAFILGIVAALTFGKVPGEMISALFGLILLTAFSVGAYFLDFARFYVYGLLAGLAPIIGEWLWRQGLGTHHGFPVMFGGGGCMMMLIGIFIFIRLLYNNPVVHGDIPSEKA
jgi:hypothetical protein